MNYTRVIFISYSSSDRDQARTLADQIRTLGYFVQFEEKSLAGDQRWSQILEQIRTADILLWVLSNQSSASEARLLEYRYARDLGRPVVGVQLTQLSEEQQTALPELTALIDYRRQSQEQFNALADALNALPKESARTPNIPLPSSAAALAAIGTRLNAARGGQVMSAAEQLATVQTLRDFAERQDTRANALSLAEQFTQLNGISPDARREAFALLNRNAPVAVPVQLLIVRMSRRNRILLNIVASIILLAILAGFIYLARRDNARLQTANPTAVAVRSFELTQTRDAMEVFALTSTAEAQVEETATARIVTNVANATRNALITATAIAAYTDTPTPTATFTDTLTFTPTATFTDTATPTATVTPSLTPSATLTNTATATFTNTPLPTATNTYTPTSTLTFTPTYTSTATLTNTPRPTATRTPQPTATVTNTAVPILTNTSRPTATAVPPTTVAPPTATRVPPTARPTATRTPLPPATSGPTEPSVPILSPTPAPTTNPIEVLPVTVFVGITVENTSQGVRVTAVGNSASNAGIQVGDIITAIELDEVATTDDFADIMNALNPFTTVSFRIRRNGVVLVELTLGINDFASVTPTPAP